MKKTQVCHSHPPTDRGGPPSQEDEEEEHHQKPYILHLPDHITMEIFCKIPTKTLFHCKRVCKSWRSCLSDPEFTKHLFSRTRPCLVVSGYTIPEPAGHFLVYLDTDLSANDAVFRLSTRVGRDCSTFIRGSCNGFIFYDIERFDGSHQLYLSNPITGESLTVPQPTKPCFKPILGFGFAPIAEVYKVVWIDENQDVNIFTVGSGIWREIGSLPCTPLRHTDFYLNGFLYWIARPRNTIFVSAFDVERERFQDLVLPRSWWVDEEVFKYSLGDLQGCLAFFVIRICDVSVWVMRESWTKELEIRDPNSFIGAPILRFTEERKVLMLRSDKLVSYNLATSGNVEVELDGFPSFVKNAWNLTPSFLSLQDI